MALCSDITSQHHNQKLNVTMKNNLSAGNPLIMGLEIIFKPHLYFCYIISFDISR